MLGQYKNEIQYVGLTSLFQQRVLGDMIQVWKFVVHRNPQIFSMATEQHSRLTLHTAKPLNIKNPNARLEVRRNIFSIRSVEHWNKLPTKVQSVGNVVAFKIAYDQLSSWIQLELIISWHCCKIKMKGLLSASSFFSP